MDEDTLAPLADALSATLAVFILLICFFVMGQVSAVSKQIKLETVGDTENMKFSVNLKFDGIDIVGDEIRFFNSFDHVEEREKIIGLFEKVTADCACKKVKIISNFPALRNSKNRATKKALVNAVKVASYAAAMGVDYEIKLVGGYNYHFVKIIEDK